MAFCDDRKDWDTLKKKDPAYDFTHFVVVCKVHQLAVGAKEDAEWWTNPEEKYLAQVREYKYPVFLIVFVSTVINKFLDR